MGPNRSLVAPAVGTGLCIATYLLLRPYGDAAGPRSLDAAASFASMSWVSAHQLGAVGLAFVGVLAQRTAELERSWRSTTAWWSGVGGSTLVLPYFGAEAFALHVVGRAALSGDMQLLRLVGAIRLHGPAVLSFGAGLVLLAIAAILTAVIWQHRSGSRAAWPFALLVTLLLPQFLLSPIARIAFGVAYAVAAGAMAASVALVSRRSEPASDAIG